MQKIYNIPTKQDNDILTQGGDSLITESKIDLIVLLTQDLEGIVTQNLENIVGDGAIGDFDYLIWDDENNLNKNYIPTLNNKEIDIVDNRKIYIPSLTEKIYGN